MIGGFLRPWSAGTNYVTGSTTRQLLGLQYLLSWLQQLNSIPCSHSAWPAIPWLPLKSINAALCHPVITRPLTLNVLSSRADKFHFLFFHSSFCRQREMVRLRARRMDFTTCSNFYTYKEAPKGAWQQWEISVWGFWHRIKRGLFSVMVSSTLGRLVLYFWRS